MGTTNLSVTGMKEPWSPPPLYDETRESARAWMRSILIDPAMPDGLRRRRIDHELWTYTEIRSTPTVKYRVRYRTESVMGEDEVEIRHEHVVPRKWLIDLMTTLPAAFGPCLDLTVACVTTKDEAQQLSHLSDDHFGWGRYLALDLKVIDAETMKPADLKALADEQQVLLDLVTRLREAVTATGQMTAVPPDDAPWDFDIMNFALTYDGYARHEDAEAVRMIAYRVAAPFFLPGGGDATLDDYRCALFFEQRWWRWQQDGSEPTGHRREWVEHLLRVIRQMSGGQVAVDPHAMGHHPSG